MVCGLGGMINQFYKIKNKIVRGGTVTAALSPRPLPPPVGRDGRARRGLVGYLPTGNPPSNQLNITPVV